METRSGGSPTRRRARLLAVSVLVAAAIVIAIVGIELAGGSLGASGTGKSVPFSILPIDTGRFLSSTSASGETSSVTLPTPTASTE